MCGRIAALGSHGATTRSVSVGLQDSWLPAKPGGYRAVGNKQIAEMLARRLEIRGGMASALVLPMILISMSMVSVIVIVFVLRPSIVANLQTGCRPSIPGISTSSSSVQEKWAERSAGGGTFQRQPVLCSGAKRVYKIEIMLGRCRPLKCSGAGYARLTKP